MILVRVPLAPSFPSLCAAFREVEFDVSHAISALRSATEWAANRVVELVKTHRGTCPWRGYVIFI